MHVLMMPHPDSVKLEGGIGQVIRAYGKYLPQFGIELVHPNSADDFDLKVVHAGMTGGDCDICMLHGIHWTADYPAPDWEYRVNAKIVEAVRSARAITVPSEWVAETLRRDLRVNPVVIPHGIDVGDWAHDEPQGDYVLWNKNRIDPHVCNPAVLFELAYRFPDAPFVSTFLPTDVPRPPNVSVTGLIPHDQMKRMIQSSLVYLATTKETGGLGILEAMAAGVPVLGYAHGAITDLVQHGVNGYLARLDDIDDLVQGVRYCVKNRAVLGANGRELARTWTWEAAVEKVAEVYRQAMEPEPPTAGVVIPCYNKSEQELRRAVESVASQTYDQLTEIIVVDDGSADKGRYAELIEDIQRKDQRVRFIQQSNRGVAHARNKGISHIRSKYICCLDADDWLEPDFLRVCIEALKADRSLGIAYAGLKYHKPDGTTGISAWPDDWDFDQQLQRKNQVPTCCVYRREMWERLGGYRQRYAPRGAGAEDAELWLRAGAYGYKAARVTGVPLFNYAWMSGQVTGDPDYKEVDWTTYHPWTKDGQHPFASYATPETYSHPVRAYDNPVVSVIIPVGPGHEAEVINALDSLEAQTVRKWEAIVVWDYHTEVPQGIATAYPYVRHYVTKEKHFAGLDMIAPINIERDSEARNFGAGFCRNRGAEIARAPFLLFLDADDWLYPQALEKMFMAWNETESIIYTDYVGKAIVDNPGQLAQDLQERLYRYDERTQEAVIGYRAHDFDCARAQRQPEGARPWIWCNVTALVPKAWHEAIGGFDEAMEAWEDVDYHYRHARAGHCYQRVDEELMVYRFYTGGRREKGRQNNKNLVQYLLEKYERSDIVGCGNCPGGTPAVNYKTPPPASPFRAAMDTMQPQREYALVQGGTIAINDDDFVRARYLTGHGGDHPVTGNATKIKYGHLNNGRELLVHKDDLGAAGIGGTFQPIQDQQRVKLPERVPTETPEPATLPGVEVKAPVAEPAQPDELPAPEELAPFVFEPDNVLKTVNTLREFISGPHASPHLFQALLEHEREGKGRKTAIRELEAAIG